MAEISFIIAFVDREHIRYLGQLLGAAGFTPQSGSPRFAGCCYRRCASRSLRTTKPLPKQAVLLNIYAKGISFPYVKKTTPGRSG